MSEKRMKINTHKCIMQFINSFSGAIIKPLQNGNKTMWKISVKDKVRIQKKINKTKILIPS